MALFLRSTMEDFPSQLAKLQKAIQHIEAQLKDEHVRRSRCHEESKHTLNRCRLQKKLAELRQEEAILVERRRVSKVVADFLREQFRSASSSKLSSYYT
jgi:hypothetical protein